VEVCLKSDFIMAAVVLATLMLKYDKVEYRFIDLCKQ